MLMLQKVQEELPAQVRALVGTHASRRAIRVPGMSVLAVIPYLYRNGIGGCGGGSQLAWVGLMTSAGEG